MEVQHDTLRRGLKNVRDNFLKFGFLNIDWCNATQSKDFSDADVNYRVMREYVDKWPRVLCFHFTDLFNDGIKMLCDLQNDYGKFEKLQLHEKKAVQRLYDFFTDLGSHEENLKKVLGKSPVTETDISVALAEHLLGKLSSDCTYVIDHKLAKGKGTCKCGCEKLPHFGNTGIGHEAVWHGHIDVVFSSHLDQPPSDIAIKTIGKCEPEVPAKEEDEEETCCSPPEKKRKREGNLEETKESTGGKSIADVKHSPLDGARKQTIAQTIVFSLLQKQNHPDLKNLLVPNILISPEEMQIIMYDAKNDVLLCSNVIKLFICNEFCLGAVIILWMVLHYGMFLNGLLIDKLPMLDEYKSHFKELTQAKWNIYSNLLKGCVSNFPVIEYEGLDFNVDFFFCAKNVLDNEEQV
ncbi:uncharacterized protein LOC134280123 [Saccostrea cucullata]|uniref:uncharacterized protein LOC134280123 n=1 Tax=Saccostrea cuccullata TaxID=36930 RepID=UPI002ECFD0FC